MYAIISILILLASVLLIGIVLIQKSKGGGLAANVNNYNQFMGVRKTTDFVEKATWTLAVAIFVLSVVSSYIAPRLIQGEVQQIKQIPAAEQQATPFETAKSGDQAQGQQAAQPAAAQETPAQEAPAQK